ncbi:chemocyanin-like [Cryptomeria japonica]|uniref:chemocyanin-like n=1 Tax=Cryptomeria japonica TaxID=3369 RepID=UPI0025ABD89C|nr:chemocyanin-like [Cryptomeria japonica]
MAMRTAGVLFVVGSLLSFLVACQATKVYTIGDEAGWTLSYDYHNVVVVAVEAVFSYIHNEMSIHNVVSVNRTAYAKCVNHPNMGLYESGSDKIVLSTPGHMWFICRTPGHYESSMKLKINVRKPHPNKHKTPSPAPAPTTEGIPASSPASAPAPAHTTEGIPAYSPASSPASTPASASDPIFLKRLTWLPWHLKDLFAFCL